MLIWLLACVHTPPSPPSPSDMSGVHDPSLAALIRGYRRGESLALPTLSALDLDTHDRHTRDRLAELITAQQLDGYAQAVLESTDRVRDPALLHAHAREALKHLDLPPREPPLQDPVGAAQRLGQPCQFEAMPNGTGWRPAAGYRRGTVALHGPIPLHLLVDLVRHECTPGHHTHRLAQAQQTGWPQFLRLATSAAIEEGWATLAEQGDATRAWRLTRVLVDTGLHADGWTDVQAREAYQTYTTLPEAQIDSELARIHEAPGTVLAYWIGAREIEAQEARARDALQEAFRLETFHRLVHKPGQSLPGLERDVGLWITSQR